MIPNKFNYVQHRIARHIAIQMTVDNQETIAEQYGGLLRGVKLPPEEREIRFTDRSGGELTARCRDWIVWHPADVIAVYDTDTFNQLFE